MNRVSADELVFVPLGGAGEIGMNLNLYGYGPANDPTWMDSSGKFIDNGSGEVKLLDTLV